jgi:hypothetical protein
MRAMLEDHLGRNRTAGEEQTAMQCGKITIFSFAIALMSSACYADNGRVWAEQFVG